MVLGGGNNNPRMQSYNILLITYCQYVQENKVTLHKFYSFAETPVQQGHLGYFSLIVTLDGGVSEDGDESFR